VARAFPRDLRPAKGTIPTFENADLIHCYVRADAIRDGVLIDVPDVARETGIRYSVALTCAVCGRCVDVPPGRRGPYDAGRR
jgi:hypothetical protein